MKKILQASALALATIAVTGSSAEAQNFTFSTATCFYTGTTACTTFGTPSEFNWNSDKSTITFTAANVNGSANGTGLFANFLLGTFSFDLKGSSSTSDLPADLKMRLRVDFTNPVGVTPDPYTFAYADIDGVIRKSDDFGNVSWDFSNNTVVFTGGPSGSFSFSVGDGSTGGYAASGQVRGSIQCLNGANNSECAAAAPSVVVPEPSTYLLMASGLVGLGIVARRRRAV